MLPAPIPDNEPERLASLRRMLLLSTPDEEAFDRVTRTAQRLLHVPVVLVSLIDERRQWFKSCIGLPVRETGRDISFCGHAIMSDDLFVIEDAPRDPRFADNPLVVGPPHVIFYAGRPLRNAEGYTVGTLCLIDHKPRRFGRVDRRSLDDLGHWVELIFLSRELSTSQQTVLSELDLAKRACMLDPMLNIWNRAAFIDMTQRERERALRQGTPLSIMMIDVDRFKHINDEYGHPIGDAVLIEIAKRLLSATRSYDNLGRYGGDEFVAALPETDPPTAMEIARRLIDSMHEPLQLGDIRLDLSISIGIASAPGEDPMPSEMELLRRADQALLTAKRNGKNCFKVFDSPALTA